MKEKKQSRNDSASIYSVLPTYIKHKKGIHFHFLSGLKRPIALYIKLLARGVGFLNPTGEVSKNLARSKAHQLGFKKPNMSVLRN